MNETITPLPNGDFVRGYSISGYEELIEALLTALPYVEDVLGNPEHLKCFKQGAVQRDVKQIIKALENVGIT